MAEKIKFIGTGKRKSSVARVSLLSPGKGNIEVNGVDVDNYVPRESLATIIKQPLNVLGKIKEYDISVNVKGGGLSGQAGAIRLGISRALILVDPENRPALKANGLLTRDSRKVERRNLVNLELGKNSNSQKDNIYMTLIKFEDLLDTGAHFGHVTRKWHPNYKPYVLMEKNGVHIINLDETISSFKKATDFIQSVVKKNGEILFIGTKKQAKDIVQQEADRCGMFYIVERWLGGSLTNFTTIKKSIKRLKSLEKEGSSLYENLTKKEAQMLNRERVKLSDQHRGIKDMRKPPDAVVIVDGQYEATAIKEATSMNIPTVALVDSNTDPNIVDFPIPANDDSLRTIQLIIGSIADSILEVKGESKDKKETGSIVDDKVANVSTETSKEEEE